MTLSRTCVALLPRKTEGHTKRDLFTFLNVCLELVEPIRLLQIAKMIEVSRFFSGVS